MLGSRSTKGSKTQCYDKHMIQEYRKVFLTPGCFIFCSANFSKYDSCSMVSIVIALLCVSMHSATVIF